MPRAYKTPITISATVRKVILGDSVALIHQDKVFGLGEVGRRLVCKSLDGFVQGTSLGDPRSWSSPRMRREAFSAASTFLTQSDSGPYLATST